MDRAATRQHRALLLGGDLVRLDHPDQSLVAGGVVAADQEHAPSSASPRSGGRSRLAGSAAVPGLDPDRRYRVTPLMLESDPAVCVLRSGGAPASPTRLRPRRPEPASTSVTGSAPEIELPGAVLSNLGLAPAQIDPEQAQLYYLEAST